jgi:hypothetical protein
MPPRRFLLSIGAGLLTPLPLLVLLELVRHAAGAASPPLDWHFGVASGFLFALGVALWRPIHPWLYGAALVPGFPLAYLLVAAAWPFGNLFPLVLFLVFLGSAIVGMSAALCGWFARRWNLPAWTPAAPIFAACFLLVVSQAGREIGVDNETPEIFAFLQKVGAAERAYAAARPDHAYTCDGPDLATLPGVEWRVNHAMGGGDRNEVPHGDYWITLRCEPAGHTSWFVATARALWQGGPQYEFDSRVGDVKPLMPLR